MMMTEMIIMWLVIVPAGQMERKILLMIVTLPTPMTSSSYGCIESCFFFIFFLLYFFYFLYSFFHLFFFIFANANDVLLIWMHPILLFLYLSPFTFFLFFYIFVFCFFLFANDNDVQLLTWMHPNL